jgi:uncharacterized protein YjbI with pentapeptide repeats
MLARRLDTCNYSTSAGGDDAVADAKKIDPFDVEALEKSLNDSATRVSTIWVSFLIFSLYLLTTVTTATHRQLLLAEPIKLPILSIDLPLQGFFFLAPILFVIFHVYVLLQVLLLDRTATSYNRALDRTIMSPPSDAAMRQRLANTLFAQIFAGSPHEREGWLGWLLKVMAWITLGIAPILILCAFEIAFLPYHDHFITWTHRILILSELLVPFLFRRLGGTLQNAFSVAVPVTFSTVFLFQTTFPGDYLGNFIARDSWSSVKCDRVSINDRIDLRGVDVVDDEKLAKIIQRAADRKLSASQSERTRDFTNRDLNCSFLSFADLRHVNLNGARLFGATLISVALDGASLHRSDLEGAMLLDAHLRGASLNNALLRGTDFSGAELQESSFLYARLEGANFSLAKLEGALLDGAQLQGAHLLSAQLSGASLINANLRGAYAANANFQGAILNGAQIQGAGFYQAQLQGASVIGGHLQGSELSKAALSETDLSAAYVWRAKNATCQNSRVSGVVADAIVEFRKDDSRNDQPVQATSTEITNFIERSIAGIPSGRMRNDASSRMYAGLTRDPQQDDTDKIKRIWDTCNRTSPRKSPSVFDQKRALFLRHLICDETDDRKAKAIANGMLRTWATNFDLEITSKVPQFSIQLARDLLDQGDRKCAAAKYLDEAAKERLRAVTSDKRSMP